MKLPYLILSLEVCKESGRQKFVETKFDSLDELKDWIRKMKNSALDEDRYLPFLKAKTISQLRRFKKILADGTKWFEGQELYEKFKDWSENKMTSSDYIMNLMRRPGTIMWQSKFQSREEIEDGYNFAKVDFTFLEETDYGFFYKVGDCIHYFDKDITKENKDDDND